MQRSLWSLVWCQMIFPCSHWTVLSTFFWLGYFLEGNLSYLFIYLFIYYFIYLFIFYFWLCWVFVSVRGLSLVLASEGHSSLRCVGLSLLRPLLLRSTGSRRAGSVVVAHGPSCSAACGIFPDQGSNPYPLHRQAGSQPLHQQGSRWVIFKHTFSHLTGYSSTVSLQHASTMICTISIDHRESKMFPEWNIDAKMAWQGMHSRDRMAQWRPHWVGTAQSEHSFAGGCSRVCGAVPDRMIMQISLRV